MYISQAQSRIVQILLTRVSVTQVFNIYNLILNSSDHRKKKRIEKEFTGVIETDLIYSYYKGIGVSKRK